MIPVSATEGDNITEKSARMPWYQGVPLLEYLENIDVKENPAETGFTMPVQRVCRPNRTFRGFQGQIESGSVSVGDTLTVLPSGESAAVRCIYQGSDEVQTSSSGHAVTIQLDSEIDISGAVCWWRIHRSAWARCLRPVSSGWMIQSWWKGKIIC